jgi:hypothetical protein
MRRSESKVLLDEKVLNVNGITTFTEELEGNGGQGWYLLWLRFKIALTVGTGTGAIAEGELAIIKSITLRSSNNDYLLNGIHGRPLYDLGRYQSERAPRKDAIAAATASYYVYIPVYFADPRLFRPEDTMVDTGRYESMTLDVTMGGVADLLTTVGTSSVILTLTAQVERTLGRLLEHQLPSRLLSIVQTAPIDLSTTGVLRVPRADQVRIKRMLIYAGGVGVANTAFSGTPSDAIVSSVELYDGVGYPLKRQDFQILAERVAIDNALETRPVGRALVDWMQRDENGSLWSSFDTTNLAALDLNMTILAGAPATPIISVALETVRPLAGLDAVAA